MLVGLLAACGSSPTANNECDPIDPKACDDGDPCTQDSCVQSGDATSCENLVSAELEPSDGILCTVDVCNEDGTQSHTPDDTKCDYCDGQTCDRKQGCVDGEPPSVEDDGDPCTIDQCAGAGTAHTPRPADPCMQCEPSPDDPEDYTFVAIDVDDAVDCTEDACDEKTGLITHTPDDTACEEGETCDVATGCSGG